MKTSQTFSSVTFAILTTTNTNQCKTLSIDSSGAVVKSSMANATNGAFKVHAVDSMANFADVLNKFTPKQSLILGTPHRHDGTALQVGESINLTIKAKPTPTAIPRSKDFIKFTNGAGFMLFDHDGGGTYEQLLEFIPELEGMGALIRPSSSSYIYDKAGNELIGAKGLHIFIPVQNVSDSLRIAAILWARQWLAGHGHYLLSAGIKPMLLERGHFDKAVLGACERLAFEAKPILQSGLVQKAIENQRIIEGDILDTSIFQDLTPDQLAEVDQLKQQAKELVKPAHEQAKKTAKAAYIANSGKPEPIALAEYERLGSGILPRDFEVLTSNGLMLVGDMNASHDGLTMCEPLERDYDGGSLTKAKFFWNKGNPKINSQAHGGIVYTIEPLEQVEETDYKAALNAHVELFNKTHAQVIIGGKHRIQRTEPAAISHDNRESYAYYEQSALAALYQNQIIQVGFNKDGKAIYKDLITAWAKHHKSRTYTGGVVFMPNGNLPHEYFNTWQGFTVKPNANSALWQGIRFHIDEVICCGNPELIEYFYNWTAYTFQFPERPAGAALVLRGGKGTGKGTIGHFFMGLWGIHALHISNAKHLTGNFNGHLNDVCFLFADEAFYSGDKVGESTLKALITEPVMTVERKGIDAIKQPNYLKVFMATNHDYAVPASKDERRYCVFDVSSERAGDKDYFDALHADINNKEVQAAFLHDMLNRDISNFHTGQIPETEGLRDQRLHSLDSVGKWLVDSFTAGGFQNAEGVSLWQDEYSAKELQNSYHAWCSVMRASEFRIVTDTQLGKRLTEIGYTKRSSNGVQRYFGTLENAINLFNNHERVLIKAPTVPD